MKIVTAALFTMMFLSVIDGVATSHLTQPKSEESINSTTTQLKNRTMIQLQSNYYDSQYPVQVITFSILNGDMIMTNDSDDVNYTQIFRLLLPPSGYDDTLCTPPSTMIAGVEHPNKTSDITDNLYPTGLLIKADTDDNCTLSNIVSNVIELNRMLPESELIQYLIFTQDSNVSYMQIDTIINEATNNNTLSEELFPTSVSITIVYMQSYYVNEIMKMIQNDEMITGCNPFLVEQQSENTTTCNFIYQLNETIAVNVSHSSGEQSSASSPYLTSQAFDGYVYFVLATVATVVIVGLVLSCLYRRYHPVLLTVPEQSALTTIEKEKNPTKLTEKQFDLLPETKYTLDLVETLKKYGNNNIVTNTTVILDEKSYCKETDSTSSNIKMLSTEQRTCDEMILEVKDCVFTDITRNEEAPPLHTTIQLDNRDSKTNSDEECGICCPICIEEFVVDEIIIILPKCNHIYHKNCIMQWLRKKQGCCPYCKVVVIDDDDDVKNDDNSRGISDLDNHNV